MKGQKKAGITTTLERLAEAEPALKEISAMELNARVRYHVVKLAQQVAAETSAFEEARRPLFDKLAVVVRGPDGLARRTVPAGTAIFDAFMAELRPVLDRIVTIPWEPLSSNDLPRASAAQLVALGPLCTLDTPTEEAP